MGLNSDTVPSLLLEGEGVAQVNAVKRSHIYEEPGCVEQLRQQAVLPILAVEATLHKLILR
jgi:hypothetical protein